MAKTIKLSTLMAANKAIKDIEAAEKGLEAMKTDYFKKNYGDKNGIMLYTSSSGAPIYVPYSALKSGLEALIEASKASLEKLGVEVDA